MINAILKFQFVFFLRCTCSLFLLFSPVANAQSQNVHHLLTKEESLKTFLQTLDNDETSRYVASFQSLSSDSGVQAIVYMVGNNWCGSGGCSTLILKQVGETWKIISKITITQFPIRVLKTKVNGWYSLGIGVRGGGIQIPYEAELDFNGKSYPKNPTISPARKSKGDTEGHIVLDSSNNATYINK
jgi:hypothetical protein